MSTGERELRFEQKMNDAEAMMWNVEKDPWLVSNIGTVTILDKPIDLPLFRSRIAAAVADIPRLRERVAPVLGRFVPPNWEPDPEFRLDYHLRHIALPPPGDERALLDVCTTILEEPFDRTRPLWLFVAIDGLECGRAALLSKLHHTVTDGEGGVRLAERYMEVEREASPPPRVDLESIIAAERPEAKASRDGAPDGVRDLTRSTLSTIGHTWRRQLGIVRRTIGEAALAAVDPVRLVEGGRNAVAAMLSARSQLEAAEPGSPLWTSRSRHRRLEVLRVDFSPARDAARTLGGSLNDFFVCGATLGAIRYHKVMGAEPESFNVTFVVSTRDDRSAGGNAFTPSKVRVPAGPMTVADRFAVIRDAMASRRSEVSGAGLMGAVAGLANLLPTSVATSVARAQASAVDFATSNVRAAPIDLYISGAKVIAPYPVGPVAGTAWNITMLSYAGGLFFGVHIDPAAVDDPGLLRRCLEEGFEELVDVAGTRVVPAEVTVSGGAS